MRNISILRFLLLAAALFIPAGFSALAQPQCSNFFASGSQSPAGYGAAWNTVSQEKELLLSGSCPSANQIAVTMGSGKDSQFVYNQGHYWDGSSWKALTLSGQAPAGSWLKKQAMGSFPAPADGKPAFFLGYVCEYVSNAWKCGCSDTACAASLWQMQAVSITTAGGGGGGGGPSNLEAPPTMDAGFVNIENVCPGEAGWPSANQIAGKDVKITMPKDRECRPSSDTAAIQGTEGNPVKDVWIVGGVLRGAGFSFRNYSGTMFIEGALIDLQGKCQDAVNGYFGRGDGGRWVVQNSYLTGIHYCVGGTHGDIAHPQGSGVMLNELKMQNVRASTVLQGLFIVPRTSGSYPGHGLKKLTLENVFFHSDPNYSYPGKNVATLMYWTESWGPPENGVSFANTYLKWWGGKDGASKNMRKDITIPNVASYDSNECAVYNASAKVTGKWCAGDPPTDFVPLAKIGLNYSRSNFTGN